MNSSIKKCQSLYGYINSFEKWHNWPKLANINNKLQTNYETVPFIKVHNKYPGLLVIKNTKT
jgi:hypothetical protein